MDRLRVRVYNVRFGDAILISVPDRDGAAETTRHILVDVGNATGTAGGADVVFKPVIDDILAVLDGRPLDLYVMTHEHLDHVQGLLYGARKYYGGEEALRRKLGTRYAWLTASAAPDYYDTHAEAKKKLAELRDAYFAVERLLAAAPEHATPWTRALMAVNDPRKTADCVAYLRGLAETTWYVHRGMDVVGKHPFREASFEILAPEEDTSIYYTRPQPMTLNVTPGATRRARPVLTTPLPPPGVDASAFYSLVDTRKRGYLDNLLAIDKAANNTSVVFRLNWRGRTLLFPGDAEHRSWQVMNKYGLLGAVDFLKVSHHGSVTGMPDPDVLDKVLPREGVSRGAIVSTYHDTYAGVPDDQALHALGERCALQSVVGLGDGAYLDFEIGER